MNSKNIIFKVEGSTERGFGHIRRSLSLLEKLPSSWHGLMAVNPNPDALAFLKTQQVSYYPLELLPAGRQYQALIFDQPESSPAWLYEFRKHNPHTLALALDSTDYHNPALDVIVNLFNHILAPKDSLPAVHCGLEYAIIGKRFEALRDIKRQDKGNISEILVMMGGADPNCLSLNAIESLEKLPEKCLINVIVGPLCPFTDCISTAAKKSFHEVVIHHNPRELPELMRRADFAISGCGTSFFELSYLGTPSIVVPQNEVERNFCRYLSERQMALYFEADEIDITPMLNCENRNSFRHLQMHTFDGKGAERILQLAGVRAR
jgi:spore coat polysaccharide biosynthesis predicted glycosyltransferase SpsG